MAADVIGKFIPLDEASESIYAYIREDSTIGQKLLIVLNLARGNDRRGEKATFKVPKEVDGKGAKLLITNGPAQEGSGLEAEISLEPYEGRIYLL